MVGARGERVTLEEFSEYYANVGSFIESDDYFSIIMNNSWNLSGNALTYQAFEKQWTNTNDES